LVKLGKPWDAKLMHDHIRESLEEDSLKQRKRRTLVEQRSRYWNLRERSRWLRSKVKKGDNGAHGRVLKRQTVIGN